MNDILSFRGDYSFLSNLYPCEVEYEGIVYPSSENAYQASKILVGREKFANWIASEAKRFGKTVTLHLGWETMKFSIMSDIICAKFHQNP